jgi:hypothetical protein
MFYVPDAQGDSPSLSRFGLALSGLAQTGGLVMLIVGAASRHRMPVYAQRVQLGPLIAAGGSGLSAMGRF